MKRLPSPLALNFSQQHGLFYESALCIRGERIGALASASVLPMNIQDWISFELTDLISLLSKGISRVLQHHNSKASIYQHSAFFMAHVSHLYMTTGKTTALTKQTRPLSAKWCYLFFNTLSRFAIVFLPRSKPFNIIAAVTICSDSGVQEYKTFHCFHLSPSICHEVMWTEAYILVKK